MTAAKIKMQTLKGKRLIRSTFSAAARDVMFMSGWLSNRAFTIPLQLHVAVTERCNLRCEMCEFGKLKGDPDHIGYECLRDTVFEAAALGISSVNITGGEPLIYPKIYELLTDIGRLGLHSQLSTNGLLLRDKVLTRIAKTGVKQLSISLDGADAKTHDEIRGVNGAFQKTIDAATRARQYGFDVTISTVIMPSNLSDLIPLAELAHQRDFQISYPPVYYRNRALRRYAHHEQSGQSAEKPQTWERTIPILSDQQLEELRQVTKQLALLKKQGFPIKDSYTFLERIPNYFKGAPPSKCSAGRDTISVQANGDVYSCWYMEPCGNVSQNTLAEILGGIEYRNRLGEIRECGQRCMTNCYYHDSFFTKMRDKVHHVI